MSVTTLAPATIPANTPVINVKALKKGTTVNRTGKKNNAGKGHLIAKNGISNKKAPKKGKPGNTGYGRYDHTGKYHRGFRQAEPVGVEGVSVVAKLAKGTTIDPTAGGAFRANVTLPSGTVVSTTVLLTYLGTLDVSTADAQVITTKFGLKVCKSTYGCKMGAGRAFRRGDTTEKQPEGTGHGTYTQVVNAITQCKGDKAELLKLIGG